MFTPDPSVFLTPKNVYSLCLWQLLCECALGRRQVLSGAAPCAPVLPCTFLPGSRFVVSRNCRQHTIAILCTTRASPCPRPQGLGRLWG